ncbi:hypothetical protein V865_003761 [Kwoniella europaea PYCC6329]|uniref:Exonuclease 1 n=1 Tax=Kwoniella europaea PYCC6329 TaxID=1423913 RepID=A0AAX4KJA7_9TREE
MGVKDLVQWVKKTHPKAITHFPNRWASPVFTGKKVAIDATLMTNRYHFASRDGLFKGKGEIIGWYNLISEMRAYGVKPIAIWDERGPREWKAPEAVKRLTARANHLARRNHELDRASRLDQFKEVLTEFQAMTEEEKDIIRGLFVTTRFAFHRPKEDEQPMDWDGPRIYELPPTSSVSDESLPPSPPIKDVPPIEMVPPPIAEIPSAAQGIPLSIEGIPPPVQDQPSTKDHSTPSPPPIPPLPEGISSPSKASQLSSTLSEADSQVIDRVVSMIDSLAPLIQEYRESQRKGQVGSKLDSEDLDLSLNGEIVEMEEDLREWIPSKLSSGGDDFKEEKVEELDSVLEELLPASNVGESPRQQALTIEEGEIITQMLSSPPLPPFKESAPEFHQEEQVYPTPPSTPQPEEEMKPDPMTRLDRLIEQLPSTRSIYERALDIPSAGDHEDCKELLKVMGVPVLEAKIPYEAEGLASALAKSGLVDYVGTEDSDVLAYEGPLLKNLSPITSSLSLISGTNLRTLTGLSPASYLDFLILLGTDASPRIPNVGPVNALKLIKAHGSIEKILENESKVLAKLEDDSIGRERFMELVNNARKVFTDLPPTSQWGNEELEEKEWDEREVERLLEERHGIQLVDRESTLQSYV